MQMQMCTCTHAHMHMHKCTHVNAHAYAHMLPTIHWDQMRTHLQWAKMSKNHFNSCFGQWFYEVHLKGVKGSLKNKSRLFYKEYSTNMNMTTRSGSDDGIERKMKSNA